MTWRIVDLVSTTKHRNQPKCKDELPWHGLGLHKNRRRTNVASRVTIMYAGGVVTEKKEYEVR